MNDKLVRLHLSEVKSNIKVCVVTIILGMISLTLMDFSLFFLGAGMILLVIAAAANAIAMIKIIARYLFDEDSAFFDSMPFSPKEMLISKIYACVILTSGVSILLYIWIDIMLLLINFPKFSLVAYALLGFVAQVTGQVSAVTIATTSFFVQLVSTVAIISLMLAFQIAILKRKARRSPNKCYNVNSRPEFIGAYILASILINLVAGLISKSQLTLLGFQVQILEIILFTAVISILTLTYSLKNIDDIYSISPHFFRKGEIK